MRLKRGPWTHHFRELGHAALDLLRAETAAIREDLGASGRSLRGGLVLVLLAAFCVFWMLGVLTFTAIVVVALRLPMWAAALTVGGVLAALATILAGVGWWRLRHLENPVQTVRRHVDDHARWWQERMLPPAVGDSVDSVDDE